ncbi:MBL fold metallo-hydrolase [Luteithermobacter gelatinilyticus]|uniref:MBL fold metallo-hydrolase n=1 Tax=Luteithermobacter gelatinilyticus TaxID=2582913 RepID=UPI001107164D|nr:MBL fold metallo-hydrolase [Luteithermobacter gelatinilyticus]|tara:strand:- start:6409 stop:7164 length:756 start_codon:yes stop_codon:yes gene_type:complete
MKVTILGCGTSGGVPRIGNIWGVCDRNNPKNRRRRSSIYVEEQGTALLVDTSPDLREQCLDAGITRLDGVLYTHDHADHTHGIDDLRGIFQCMKKRVDVYAGPETRAVLKRRFDYIFTSQGGYPAIANMHEIETSPFRIGAIDIQPFLQNHGNTTSYGFRLNKVAYSTDFNVIPEESHKYLHNLDLWVVDALRPEPHPTHTHLERTLDYIKLFKPKRAVLTHMTWDMDYATLKKQLPGHIEPAYDGMVINL